VLQCVAMCCSVLQWRPVTHYEGQVLCVAVCVAVRVAPCVAPCFALCVALCVAVYVAMCCNMLQCVVVAHSDPL